MANNWHDKTDEPDFGTSDIYSLEETQLKHKYVSPLNKHSTPRATKTAIQRQKNRKRNSGNFWKKLNRQ